jgi:hypothetical protein
MKRRELPNLDVLVNQGFFWLGRLVGRFLGT